jgi:hypothetical protein
VHHALGTREKKQDLQMRTPEAIDVLLNYDVTEQKNGWPPLKRIN